MRETTKQVVRKVNDEDRTFQIRKMNALSGSVLLKFVAEKFMPLLGGLQDMFTDNIEDQNEEEVVNKRMEAMMTIIPQALASISEEELMSFEQRCLNTVDILMPAGWQPVMVGKNFGVEELEYEPITILLLCYDVVEFNLGGFFGGKGLTSLRPPQSISQPDA